MSIRFEKLFSIAQRHAYYEGACHDLGFVMPTETLRRLAGGRLIAKTLDDVLHVLFEADDAKAPLNPISGQTLRFGLTLRNTQFANFTQLPVSPAQGVMRFANSAAPAVLAAPSALELDKRADKELIVAGAVGVVDIQVAAAFYGAAPTFELAFAARQQTLKYYVVASNYSAADANLLSVADAGFEADERAEIAFTKVASAAFSPDDIPAALLGDASQRIVLFKSQAALERRARGRKRLQLSRNGQVLIDSLPQPGAHAAAADVIVHVSKP